MKGLATSTYQVGFRTLGPTTRTLEGVCYWGAGRPGLTLHICLIYGLLKATIKLLYITLI